MPDKVLQLAMKVEVIMFELDQFVAECRSAFARDPTHKAVREVLALSLIHISEPTRPY